MKNSIVNLKLCKVLLLFAVLLPALIFPMKARAKEQQKEVRVGWYESPFNTTDESGRKSGYAYEYQLKIAAYSGWNYRYVTGSWFELMQMLENGEIDLMSDVSFTEERAEKMFFSELPMGAEEYYIFLSPGNTEISVNDYSTLNGKKIGVNKGSVQVDIYREWAERNGVEAVLTELTCSEKRSLQMLSEGEFDAYITPNIHIDLSKLVPFCKIGYSDFYFVVNKDRPDLLNELNDALNRIQGENPFYNQRMFETYVQTFGANGFLSDKEEAWLKSHGTIRVGYQDNYLAFCAKDKDTGKLTGALKEFLENAENCFKGSHIDFEPVSYPTAKEAIDALKQGKVDCVFPANLEGYDGEIQKLMITPSLIRTDMYAIVRTVDYKVFNSKENVIVAVNKGNPNYDTYLSKNFPNWCPVYFENTADCLKAVSEGVADCVIISSFRYNNISGICEKYHLTTYSTGVALDYCFAVSKGQTELYSIFAKAIGLVPGSTINAALAYYVAQDARMTLGDFIFENITFVVIGVSSVILLIVLLMVRSIILERKAKKLILSTETDDLTGLYNRDYFYEYANRLSREQPGIARDAIVIKVEKFNSTDMFDAKQLNNSVLRIIGNEVKTVANENGGIAGRCENNQFDIYLKHLNDYRPLLERFQNRLNNHIDSAGARISMGVMQWKADFMPVQLFDMASTACNSAHVLHNDRLIIFDKEMQEKEFLNRRLLNDINRALDNYEFEVYYQPIFDINDDKPKLTGAEALVRWLHPELGMISPDSFIPLFEKNDLIGELDKYVWKQAARQVARWKAEFDITVPVSVNISRIDLFDKNLSNTLDDIIIKNALTRDCIKLEVTESAYTEDPDQVVNTVANLRKKGYIVEMDDFGAGYSSLNMLSEMPVDVIKMDRAFVRHIETSEKDVQLVTLILEIAKKLGIPAVAEGVETEEQFNILKQFGCAFIQGYYFSRPLPPDEFKRKYLGKR
ncbi:MAG: EAL domain-containing protein [Clostridiales bacterium]|nr:EAL domain-containing protein [Clostridiales bacterium]